jgi:transposase InsO family protein
LFRTRSDNGTEFCNKIFDKAAADLGLWKTTTVPYCPAMNGRAERAVQTLKRGAASALLHGSVSTLFWDEAMSQQCYITRHRLLYGEVPRDTLQTGDVVMVKRRDAETFTSKVDMGIFLAYSETVVRGSR